MTSTSTRTVVARSGDDTSSSSAQQLTTTIEGVTYDITDFIKRHPGGEDILLCGLNRDATILFHSYHRNTDKVKEVLKKLPVVGGTHQPNNTIDTPLYKTIKQRVNKYFEDTKQSSRGTEFMWFKSAILILATLIAYYFTMVQGYWMVSPILGLLMAINGLAVQHDANHGAFAKNKLLNRLASAVDDIIGGSSLVWRHQHVVLHHTYPNHHEIDGDSYGKFPILRLNPKLGLTWYFPYQYIYAPSILYSLIGLAYTWGDVTTFLDGFYLTANIHPYRAIDYVVFWGGKFLHYLLFAFVPMYLHGWQALFTLYIVMEIFGGNFLASLFAVSHNTSLTEYNVKEDMDWAEMQIKTSANWSVNSTFWWLISGGLNYQIEHHLFPGVCHVHYPQISKIVQQVCKEKKLPYNAYPTFYAIYQDHVATLKKLGKWKQ